MLKPIKDFFWKEEKPLEHKSPKILKRFYFFIHFITGFISLWFTYYVLTNLLEHYNGGLIYKATLESAYLIFGVIYGNIGWDRFKLIETRTNKNDIYLHMLSSIKTNSYLTLLVFMVALITSMLLNNDNQTRFELFIPRFGFIFAILMLVLMFFMEKKIKPMTKSHSR